MIHLTKHAIERCEEMDIETSIPIRIYESRTMTYPGNRGTTRKVIRSADFPDYLIVVDQAETVVITVSFNTPGVTFAREGGTYRAVAAAD